MTIKYIKNDKGDFVCPHCNVVKKNQNTMFYHIKKHGEQLKHICKSCKKQFLQKQTLELHIRSKHPDLINEETINNKKFKCPYDNCEFSSLTKGNCLIHFIRVHCQDEVNSIMIKNNDTKTIECSKCHNEFNNSCSFYYHCKSCINFIELNEKYNKLQHIICTF